MTHARNDRTFLVLKVITRVGLVPCAPAELLEAPARLRRQFASAHSDRGRRPASPSILTRFIVRRRELPSVKASSWLGGRRAAVND